jgi:hypothetical protein
MLLSAEEELLVRIIRSLPPEEAQKVRNWAVQLLDLSKGQEFHWSDDWTDEDIEDVTRASLRRFDEQENVEH